MERNDPLPSWRPGSTRDALEAFLAAAEEVDSDPADGVDARLRHRGRGQEDAERDRLPHNQGDRSRQTHAPVLIH